MHLVEAHWLPVRQQQQGHWRRPQQQQPREECLATTGAPLLLPLPWLRRRRMGGRQRADWKRAACPTSRQEGGGEGNIQPGQRLVLLPLLLLLLLLLLKVLLEVPQSEAE